MACINLNERFGDRYKIGWDPAYDPRHRPRDKLDPWMMLLLCERAVIYPWGGSLLAVEVVGRRPTAKRLAALNLKQVQDGDTEAAFVFDIMQLEAVAALVKPRRRRRVSEKERTRLAELSRKHGFGTRQSHRPVRSQKTVSATNNRT